MCYSCYPRYQKLRGLHRPNFRKHKQVKRLFIAASPEGCILFITAIKSSVVLKLIVAWKREYVREEPGSWFCKKKTWRAAVIIIPRRCRVTRGSRLSRRCNFSRRGRGATLLCGLKRSWASQYWEILLPGGSCSSPVVCTLVDNNLAGCNLDTAPLVLVADCILGWQVQAQQSRRIHRQLQEAWGCQSRC